MCTETVVEKNISCMKPAPEEPDADFLETQPTQLKSQRTIARQKLFEPPTTKEREILNTYRGTPFLEPAEAVARLPEIENLFMSSHASHSGKNISFARISNLMSAATQRADPAKEEAASSALTLQTEEIYLTMLCDYVNRYFGKNKAGQVPHIGMSDFSWFYTLQKDEFFELPDSDRYTMTAKYFSTLSPKDEVFAPEQFLQMKYFLSIVSLPRFKLHHILISISPLARTVEVLDSLVRPVEAWPQHQEEVRGIFGALKEYLGDLFIPSEWRYRAGHSKRQGKSQQCGAFSLTNAACLALGYEIDFPCDRDHPKNIHYRRMEMALEMLNGSIPDEKYRIFDIPIEDLRDPKDGWLEFTGFEDHMIQAKYNFDEDQFYQTDLTTPPEPMEIVTPDTDTPDLRVMDTNESNDGELSVLHSKLTKIQEEDLVSMMAKLRIDDPTGSTEVEVTEQ